MALIAPPSQAAAQKRSFIRDAEVETTIRTMATPLFQAAGLSPDAVRIFLIVDNSINAFVAGGQNMFFHTGLLIRTDHPGQLIGVIAHETGHIAGGHLARLQDAASSAGTEALIATLLGAAAGIASGRGDVAAAVTMGGQEIAMRSLLAYSRGEESAADQAAIRYLDVTGQSARGMLEFFQILGDQELLVASRQDPYVRTHPLTRDRVTFVRDQVEVSTHADAPVPPEVVAMHSRMRAKLFAFLEPPSRTLLRYRDSDNSLDSRYARAIAAYRKPDMAAALPLIDSLIAEYPKDPYFHELKGQMLFENGRGRESLEPYRRSVDLLPDNALLRISLAQAQVETDETALLEEARTHLNWAVQHEPENRTAWRLLAIAHGRLGDEGMAAFAMAEQSLLEGRLPDATFHAGKAERLVGKGTPTWLRIQDIKENAAHARDEKERRK